MPKSWNESFEVEKVFKDYQKALLNDNGNKAIQYLDSKTIKWYSDVLYHTKNTNRSDLEKLPFMEKMTALLIRGVATYEEIISFDVYSFMAFSVNNGLVDKNSTTMQTLANISVNDQYASADILMNEQDSNADFEFRKEKGSWKLDLTSIVNSPIAQSDMDKIMNKIIERNQSINNENEALEFLLKINPKVKFIDRIWEPVNANK